MIESPSESRGASSVRFWSPVRVGLSVVVALAGLVGMTAQDASATTQTFTVAGAHNFVVPAGITSIYVKAVGAAGAGCSRSFGGSGASVTAVVPVSPGEQLYVGVGGAGTSGFEDGFCSPDGGVGGFGGGANGGTGQVGTNQPDGGGGGGGASVVGPGSASPTFATLLVVAGGGGGGAYFRNGGNAGESGEFGNAGAGWGGTTSGGGAGGAAASASSTAGAAGTMLVGGAGGNGPNESLTNGGGGGGGGYYGGGGGGGAGGVGLGYAGAGGGGSSYVIPSATNQTSPAPSFSPASVTIVYPAPESPTATIFSPAAGAAYEFGHSVPTNFVCDEGPFGFGLASCTDSTGTTTVSGGTGNLDTSTFGTHTYTVTATSSDGFVGSSTTSYLVAVAPTARISAPAPGAVYSVGQSVSTAFACDEGRSGTGLLSCADSTGSSGTSRGNGHLDTSTPGAHTYSVTATSTDGLTGVTSTPYTVAAPPNSPAAPSSSGSGSKSSPAPKCQVPKLIGRALQSAKQKLSAAHCKLGKVKKTNGVTSKTGKVKKQSVMPGKVLGAGAKVGVTLG